MGCHVEEGLALFGMSSNVEVPGWQVWLNIKAIISRTQIKRNSTSKDAGFVHHCRTSGGSMTVTEMFWRQLADQLGSRGLH